MFRIFDCEISVHKTFFFVTHFGVVATQIAKEGKISNYSNMNWLWKEIDENESIDWKDYKNKYQKMHNQVKSEFKKIAPLQRTQNK